MAFVPTQDVIAATVLWQDANAIVAQNRFWCFSTDPQTLADLQEVTEALYDLIVANIIPYTDEHWNLTGISARQMSTEFGLYYVDENSYPVQGGDDSSVAPANQVSYTVTLNTGLVGRSQRGRLYGVGVPNTFHSGNRLTDTIQPILQSKWELIRIGMETAGHALQVVSFQEGGVLRAEGRPLPVLSTNVRFPLATQRRRLA